MTDTAVISVVRKISDIDRQRWDALARGCSPFLGWDWLDCFEQTGCVSEQTGWLPHHLTVERGDDLIAACPMYLKLHSMGEFVFDWEWADAAHRAGIQYFPKMLVGIPFTPVAGSRFLTAPGENRRALVQEMGRALAKIASDNKISSVHVNFCLNDEREALEEVGFFVRNGLQFHWRNRGFGSFEDYLGSFRSDRRNKIKRERREIAERGIVIRAKEGEELTRDDVRTMFRLYKRHVDQLYYGRQYLTREFFEEVHRRCAAGVCLMLAERDRKIIAGTFNVRDDQAMYGRYWGTFEEVPFLHFNVCYYSAIEHCIGLHLTRFEAGAGGSFKQLRGLEPETTTSVHYISNGGFRRAVERFLIQEREMIRLKRENLLDHSQLKPKDQEP